MKREEKAKIIEQLAAKINETPNFYLADIAGLNAEKTFELRRACFEKNIELMVVKNTLLHKALETLDKEDVKNLYPTLEGSTAIMFTTVPNAPARLIKEVSEKIGKPSLKSAFVQECAYVGENQLDTLVNIKSREELIGDIITLLQSPVKNVISALKSSGGDKIAGIVKTLSDK